MYYRIKNHSKLFLFFCAALALSEGGGDWCQQKGSLLKLKILD